MSSQALTVQQQNQVALKSFFEGAKFKGEIALALPRHVKPDRFVRLALTAINQNPKLLDCSRDSIGLAMLKAAASGLEVGRECHIIPYGKDAQYQPDYKGIVSMLRRSGEVADVHADVVREGDEFSYCYGSGSHLKHKPSHDRGDVTDVYSYVRFKDGSESFEVMSVDDVNHVRDTYSRGYQMALKYNNNDHPWIKSWDSMACKTCFKKHSKWLPLSAELRDLIDADNDDVPASSFDSARQVNERPAVPAKDKGVTSMRQENAADTAKNADVVENDVSFDVGPTPGDTEDAPTETLSDAREKLADAVHEGPEANATRKPRRPKATNPAPQETPPETAPAATPEETTKPETAGGNAAPEGDPAVSENVWPRTVRGEVIEAVDKGAGDPSIGYRQETANGKTLGVIKKLEIKTAGYTGTAYYLGKDVSKLTPGQNLIFELARQEATPTRPVTVIVLSYRDIF